MENFSEKLQDYIQRRIEEFYQISNARKQILYHISNYVKDKIQNDRLMQIIAICTHNSRRSFFAQAWIHAASVYYNLVNIKSFSGGTTVSKCHPKTIKTLEHSGFHIAKLTEGDNTMYEIKLSESQPGLSFFSKKYDHPTNPQSNFLALMVCSEADSNCPFIPNAEKRISLPYDDPKAADETPYQDEVYNQCCAQIAREILYAFSQV